MQGESFIDQFSSISLKRRHGILRILSGGAAFEVWFHDGRISEVRQSSGRDAQDICGRLVRSGEIHEKVFELVDKKRVSIAQLFDLLVSRNFAAPAQFHRAKRAHDLDLLHAIGLAEETSLEFQVQDVRPDPRFPNLLSPGQLLLDLCELQQDEERFQTTFGAEDISQIRVTRQAPEVKGLCDFESVVWDMISETRRLTELFHGLLSEYEVKEGLLGLLDRGAIKVDRPTEGSSFEGEIADEVEDLSLREVEEPNDLWGKIADDAVGAMLQDFDDLLALKDTKRDERAVATEDEAEPAVLVSAEPVPTDLIQPIEEQAEEIVPSSDLESLCRELQALHDPGDGKKRQAKPVKVALAAGAASPQDTITLSPGNSLFGLFACFCRLAFRHGMRRALFETNHLFLEQARLERVILATILAFLFSMLGVCLLGGFIDNFLASLADFSSAAFLSVVE